MQKAEYRYYEISQDLPVMALSGNKWETIYGADNMHFHNCLEIGYCHYGNGTIYVAEKELPYHAGTVTFIPKIHHIGHVLHQRNVKKNKNGNIYLWIWKKS